MIVTIGTDDTLASPGAQLDYYQSLIDTMGQARLDGFARLFVMPQAGHGLSGTNYGFDRGRKGGARRADSECLRPIRAARELGRTEGRAGDVGRRQCRREEPAALLVSGVPRYMAGRPPSRARTVCVLDARRVCEDTSVRASSPRALPEVLDEHQVFGE